MGIASKDKRDIYYRMAKENNYRARSAYKLLHIDETFNIFKSSCKHVVDLCSAPGSWSQVCSMKESVRQIISVDLLDIVPLEKTVHFADDITDSTLPKKIISILNGKADLVLCDGAPDITGLADLDEYYQNKLVLSALRAALLFSKMGSTFISKIFRGSETMNIINHVKKFYRSVRLVKPLSSRNMSIESFILAEGLYNTNYIERVEEAEGAIEVLPCGSGPDPDRTYDRENISVEHKYKPIDPPYKNRIFERRNLN